MSSGDKWEVVGKKGIKPEKNIGKENKRKNEKLYKIQPQVEIEESKTMFGALLEAESRRDTQLLEQLDAQRPTKLSITARPKLPIHQALANVDVEEIERLYMKQKQLLPAEKEKWVRNIVTLFNNSFANIVYDEAKFNNDFPLSYVTAAVERFFVEMMSEFPDEYWKAILLEFIELVFHAQQKGVTYVGYQVFIQILLKKKPSIVLKNLDQFESLVQRSSKVSGRGVCVLWTLSQAGRHTLKDALTIWTRVMLDYITVKAYSSVIISFITDTFKNNWKLEDGFGIISKADYFKIFSEVFSRSPTLPPTLHHQLTLIYPQIKILAWGVKSENLHNFFAGYLNRCGASDNTTLKNKHILSCLVECLVSDGKSFARWIDEFPKHITETRLLLEHLSRESVGGMDVARLRVVLLFIVKRANQPVAVTNTTNPDLLACLAISQVLLGRIGIVGWGGQFGRILRILSVIVISLLAILTLASLSHPHLNNVLREKFGLGEDWLVVLEKIQQGVLNIFTWVGESGWWLGVKRAWRDIGMSERISCAVDCVGERLGSVGAWIAPTMSMLGWGVRGGADWVARKLLMLAYEAQLFAGIVVDKCEPVIHRINQQLMAWLPGVLERLSHAMNACLHLLDGCLRSVNYIASTATTWLQHNLSSLSLKDIFS